MKQYLDILRNIIENGVPKQPVRVGADGTVVKVENGTIGTFCEIFRHQMAQGFPLLTTKRVPLRLVAVELEGFIKGITSKSWYQDRNCHIWDEWANPVVVNGAMRRYGLTNKKLVQEDIADLGPIYGRQWRNFDGHFHHTDVGGIPNGVNLGSDQLKYIADTLRSNPLDRRMVCSAWNPNQKDMMALPPCHYAWNCVVYNGRLNLCFHMRSLDAALGLPFNIASYGLLLKILAKHSNLQEGELVGVFADAHVYDNQMDGVNFQLTREPRPLPTLEIPNNDGESFDIFKWDHTQLNLVGYDPHPAIKMEVTV